MQHYSCEWPVVRRILLMIMIITVVDSWSSIKSHQWFKSERSNEEQIGHAIQVVACSNLRYQLIRHVSPCFPAYFLVVNVRVKQKKKASNRNKTVFLQFPRRDESCSHERGSNMFCHVCGGAFVGNNFLSKTVSWQNLLSGPFKAALNGCFDHFTNSKC